MMGALLRHKVAEKLLAVVHGDVVEAAAAATIVLEVTESRLPVVAVLILLHLLLEIVEEALTAFCPVEETKLLIDYRLRAAALDEFRLLHHRAVVLLLEPLRGVGIDVYAQILAPCHPSRPGMADSRVIVKVE